MRIILAIAAIVLATKASAEPIWQNVTSDMDVAALQGARPGVHAITDVEKPNYLHGCDYVEPGVVVNEVPMAVCYGVKGGKVTMVQLTSSLLGSNARVSEFKTMLATKYGAAVDNNCSSNLIGRSCDTTWKQGGVSITSHAGEVEGEYHIVITYSVVPAGDVSKL